MPLFGRKDHSAEDEAARVHFARLMALSAADLAAELMPAFGPDGPRRGKNLNVVHLNRWFVRGYRSTGGVPLRELHTAVTEAVQVLQNAELIQLTWPGGGHSSRQWNATRLGAESLAKGDYRQRINDRTGL
jgi:hypothetical protein